MLHWGLHGFSMAIAGGAQDKLPDGWSAERFKVLEGGDARVGIKGTAVDQRLGRGFGWLFHGTWLGPPF